MENIRDLCFKNLQLTVHYRHRLPRPDTVARLRVPGTRLNSVLRGLCAITKAGLIWRQPEDTCECRTGVPRGGRSGERGAEVAWAVRGPEAPLARVGFGWKRRNAEFKAAAVERVTRTAPNVVPRG